MSASFEEQLIMDAIDLEDVSVGRDEGRVILSRSIDAEQTELEDLIELVHDHGRGIINVQIDLEGREARVIVPGTGGEE